MIYNTNHPQINEVYQLYSNENEPFRKIHRMIDLFEVIIKTHTAAIIGSYFSINHVSDQVKALLAQGLKTPSLGTWQFFSRVIVQELIIQKSITQDEMAFIFSKLDPNQQSQFIDYYLQEEERFVLDPTKARGNASSLIKYFQKTNFELSPPLIHPDFYQYFLKWDKTVDQVIAKRNYYAHGSTPTNEVCLEDICELTPILHDMLSVEWLNGTAVIIKNEKNSPYLVDGFSNSISLFPILVCQGTKGSANLVFFNDLKKLQKKTISLLHYPTAHHIYNEEIYRDFLSVLNVHYWKHKNLGEFKERIEELIEVFKGRKNEIDHVLQFIKQKKKGFLFIHGVPGIGKSALIAKTIDLLKKEKSHEEYHVIEYFIRRGTPHANAYKFLVYMSEQIESIVKTPFPIPYGKGNDEVYDSLQKRLAYVSTELPSKKLILFIDGLDEGIEKEQNMLEHMINSVYSNILIIYTSRDVQLVKEFYFTIPIERRDIITLSGLTKSDIRAMLYEVVDKYQITPQYVDAIEKKCSGNPLYLKMLCNALENGEINLNNIDDLPKKVEEFYESMILRFSKHIQGDSLLQSLYLFAAMKDYLSNFHLEQIQQLTKQNSQEILYSLHEILIEDPGNEAYHQLFHESLREYLYKHEKSHIREANRMVAAFCSRWREWLKLLDFEIAKYPLLYYSKHLLELGWEEELFELVRHEDYIQHQISYLNQFDASFSLYNDAIKIAAETKDSEKLIDTALKTRLLFTQLENSYTDIFKWCKQGGEQNYRKALTRIKLFEDKKKFVLYILILDSILSSTEKPNKTLVESVMHQMDQDLIENINGSSFLPTPYLLAILEKLIKLEVDVSSILSNVNEMEVQFERLSETLQTKILSKLSVSLIQQLLDSKKLLCTEETIRQMEDPIKKSIVLSHLSKEAYKNADERATERFLTSCINLLEDSTAGQAPDILLNIVNCYTDQMNWEQALLYLEQCTDIPKQNIAYIQMAGKLVQIGRTIEAYELIKKSFYTVKNTYKYYMRSYLVERLIKEVTKINQFDFAVKLIRQMPEGYLKGLFLTFASTEAYYHKNEHLCNQLIQEATEIHDRPIKTSFIFSRLAIEMVKQNKDHRFKEMMEKVTREGQHSWPMSRTAILYIETGRISEAMELMDSMEESWMKNDVYLSLINHHLLGHDLKRASDYLERISLETQYNQGFESICKYVYQTDPAQFYHHLHPIFKKNFKLDHKKSIHRLKRYAYLSNQYFARGEEALSIKFFKIGKRCLDEILSKEIKGEAARDFGLEFAKRKRLELSAQLMKQAHFTSEKADLEKYVALDLCEKGRLDEALKMINEIPMEYEHQRIDGLVCLSNILYRQGRSTYKKIYEEAVFRAEHLEITTNKNPMILNMVLELLQCSRFSEAYERAITISDDSIKAEALRHLAVWAYSTNKDKGMEILREIGFPLEKALGLIQFAELESLQNSKAAAQSLMVEAASILLNIDKPELMEEALKALSILKYKCGSFENAVQDILIMTSASIKVSTFIEMAEISCQNLQHTARLLRFIKEKMPKKVSLDFYHELTQLLYLYDEENFEDVVFMILPEITGHPDLLNQLLEQYVVLNRFIKGREDKLVQSIMDFLKLDHLEQPRKGAESRFSEDWVNGIADEDLKYEVQFAINRFKKGKVTEDELKQKIKALFFEYEVPLLLELT